MITREWIKYEIDRLESELSEALDRIAESNRQLKKAKADHNAACELAETLTGCIRGWKIELACMGRTEETS
jgi:hypothetical protein